MLGLPASIISGVSLHGINHPSFHLLHNSYMVRHHVLVPVKKDHIPRPGQIPAILPASLSPKPRHPIHAMGKFGIKVPRLPFDFVFNVTFSKIFTYYNVINNLKFTS